MKILDRLDELEKAATPGPWGSDGDHINNWVQASNGDYLCNMDYHLGDDADLIAESRNALRALIDVARAAESCVKSTLLPAECYSPLKAALEALCPEK